MCVIKITTYTTCGCRITIPEDCLEFERKIKEGEDRYSKHHLRTHDKDGVSKAPAISRLECPLYYEEPREVHRICVFCTPRTKNDVRLTKELDELQASMDAKMEAAKRTGKGWFGKERCVTMTYPNGIYHNLY